MINLHEGIRPGQDRTRDPWICSPSRTRCLNFSQSLHLNYTLCIRAANVLASVHSFAGLPGPSLQDNATRTKILCACPYVDLRMKRYASLELPSFYFIIPSTSKFKLGAGELVVLKFDRL